MALLVDRIERVLAMVANVLGVAVFIALTGVFFAVIASRVVPGIGAALTSADELIRFLFVWLVFVGSIVAMQRGDHIRITFIRDALPLRLGALVAVVGDLISIGFLYVMTTAGLSLVQLTTNQRSVGLGIPMHLVHAVIPISGAAMLLYVLISLLRNASALLGKSHGAFLAPKEGTADLEAYQ